METASRRSGNVAVAKSLLERALQFHPKWQKRFLCKFQTPRGSPDLVRSWLWFIWTKFSETEQHLSDGILFLFGFILSFFLRPLVH